MKKIFFGTVTLMVCRLLCGLAFSETITFKDPRNQEGFNLISQSSSNVEVVYSVQRLRFDSLDVGYETFDIVIIPGIFLPRDAGAPNLPGEGRMIAIPQGATADVEILAKETEIYEGIDVIPALPIPEENEDSPPVYEKDPSIYSLNEYYPQSPVFLSEPAKIRGVDYVILGITPFQYNPVTLELKVFTNIRVQVNFLGGNGHFGEDRLRSRHWDPILKGNLLNFESLPSLDFNRLPSMRTQVVDCEYVIIVPDDQDFIDWADVIKEWRALQGIITGVLTLSEIGGNDATLIENFINDAYANWNIPPVAVLLLSDYQSTGLTFGITSPLWNNYCVSDNIYADVDEDNLPDIFLARITAQNETHLEEMITKFISYENDPPVAPGFYDNPLISGGWQSDRWYILYSEICWGFLSNILGKNPIREYALVEGQNPPGSAWSSNPNTPMIVDYFGPNGLGYIPSTPQHLNDWNANADRINADINNGAFIVQHRDHGYDQSWVSPWYHIDDLAELNNDMLPFGLSINCSNGTYNSPLPCFAEAFHRMPHGVSGVIAAARVSFSFLNDVYGFGLFDFMWPNFDPGYGVDGIPQLKPCMANYSGKYYLETHQAWPINYQSRFRAYHQLHHHGDAFITLYSEIPQYLSVTHDDILVEGAEVFTVTANEGALIGLTVDEEIIGTGDATGGPLNIAIVPQTAGAVMTVTVTLANYYRYSQTVDVVTSGELSGEVYDNGGGGPLVPGQSPYYVVDDAWVPNGQQLTIEPGVTIYFYAHKKLTAYGLLTASATSSLPVKFLAFDAIPDEDGKIIWRDLRKQYGGAIKIY